MIKTIGELIKELEKYPPDMAPSLMITSDPDLNDYSSGVERVVERIKSGDVVIVGEP